MISTRLALQQVGPGGAIQFGATLRRVAERYGNQAALRYAKAVLGTQANISEAMLKSAIVSKQFQRIDAAVQASVLGGNIENAMRKPLGEAAQQAGMASTNVLNAYGITASFNASHPNVTLYARQRAANLVVGIHEETRKVIRTVIAAGNEFGLTVDQQARAIREVVGLPPQWATAPINLGNAIRNGDISGAVGRKLSAVEKQMIRSRILNGTVTEGFISDMQKRYAQKLVNLRARTIARTETLAAVHYGQLQSWQQAVDQKALPTTVRRFWVVTPDERLSLQHSMIPGLNPQGRRIDEPFVTTEGLFMYPPSRPNCRCTVGLMVPPRTGVVPDLPQDALAPAETYGAIPVSPNAVRALGMQSSDIDAAHAKGFASGTRLSKRPPGAHLNYDQVDRAEAMAMHATKDLEALGVTPQHFQLHGKDLRITIRGGTTTPTPFGADGALAVYSPEEHMIFVDKAALHNFTALKQAREAGAQARWHASHLSQGTMHHELGHALHQVKYAGQSVGTSIPQLPLTEVQKELIKKQVGKYAAENSAEFVAETFSGMVSGRRYSDEIMDLYRKYDGFIPPAIEAELAGIAFTPAAVPVGVGASTPGVPYIVGWADNLPKTITTKRLVQKGIDSGATAEEILEASLKHRPGARITLEDIRKQMLKSPGANLGGAIVKPPSPPPVENPLDDGIWGLGLSKHLDERFNTAQVTRHSQAAIKRYQGTTYVGLNRELRREASLTVPTSTYNHGDTIAAMDKAFRDVPSLGKPAYVWRGAGSKNRLPGVGGVWTDWGYGSTSTSVGTAAGFSRAPPPVFRMVRIGLRSEQKVLWVKSVGKNIGESEAILPRGTQFRVVRIRRMTKEEWNATPWSERWRFNSDRYNTIEIYEVEAIP